VSTLEPIPVKADPNPAASPRVDLFGSLAASISRAGPGDRAALARLQPDALTTHQLAALARALLAAGLAPEEWRSDSWPRWALIAHGMALAGLQLAQAGVSESRVTKLLTSRGDAFTQLLPRILRLLASKGVQPNWRELGTLVLNQDSRESQKQASAEATRLAIAGPYFSTVARAAGK
jgi:CRISPR system Cascade subunit CasB